MDVGIRERLGAALFLRLRRAVAGQTRDCGLRRMLRNGAAGRDDLERLHRYADDCGDHYLAERVRTLAAETLKPRYRNVAYDRVMVRSKRLVEAETRLAQRLEERLERLRRER